MDLSTARNILNLSVNYTQAELKSNYHRLAKKYHPDKNKNCSSEQFIKIQEAYEYLCKEPEKKLPEDIIGDILKTFNFFKKTSQDIFITPLEYFTGTTKKEIVIPKTPDLTIKYYGYRIFVTDDRYKVFNRKMTCLFDITLKESLVGFSKTFKDPFGKIHKIEMNKLVKQNDGFSIIIENEFELILRFNIVYPEKLSKSDKKILSNLNLGELDASSYQTKQV
jgi:DnaJ-class molecular chaperone